MEIAMANASAKVTEINLKLKPQELSILIDALYENLEDMECANDDLPFVVSDIAPEDAPVFVLSHHNQTVVVIIHLECHSPIT